MAKQRASDALSVHRACSKIKLHLSAWIKIVSAPHLSCSGYHLTEALGISLIFAGSETKVQCASVAAKFDSSASDLPKIALRIADLWSRDSATPLGRVKWQEWVMQKQKGHGMLSSVRPGRGEEERHELGWGCAGQGEQACRIPMDYSLFIYHSPSVPRLQRMYFIFLCCHSRTQLYGIFCNA